MNKTTAVLVALAALLGPAGVHGAPIPTRPVYTSKTRFRIPYRYRPAEMKRLGAVEIRLYVSADAGRHWRHAGSVDPAAGRFEFTAPGEGEYWFAVRTLDDRERLHPQGDGFTPGLKVIVDNTPPGLEVDLREPKPGRVGLSWTASDQHLNAKSLQLEYRQGDSPNWQPVRVAPKAAGRTSWSVPEGGMVAVRGRVSDLAQNTTQASRQIRVAASTGRVPEPPPEAIDEPVAWQSGDPGPGPNSSGAETGPSRVVPNHPDRRTYELRPTESMSAAWPGADEQPQRNRAPSSPPKPPVGRLVSERKTSSPTPVIDGGQPDQPGSTVSGSGPKSASARIVDSDQFEITYEIEDVGPSGVGAVEFYITQNGGAKWWKFGDDLDHESPFEVSVPGDGTYGFDVRVRNGVGLADPPPQPGEQPSIVVVVDQTPPVVQLFPPQQGQGATLNQVLIRWKASDENPAEKPISLAYSRDRQGPWTAITDWREDSGSYRWTVGEDVPPRVYLALAARDAAGNVRRVVTPEPIVVDLKKPSARIVEIRTADGGGETPR